MSAMLQTERLALRRWEVSDAPSAFLIFSSPAVARWLAPAFPVPDSLESMRSTLTGWHGRYGMPAAGGAAHWALQTRSETRPVGALSLQYAPAGSASLSIAWALAPDCWGLGYAAEAGEALIRWAMHEHGVREIFAFMEPGNSRSVATARRIGMIWVTELGHLADGKYQVYRLRHADLALEEARDRRISTDAGELAPMTTSDASETTILGTGR